MINLYSFIDRILKECTQFYILQDHQYNPEYSISIEIADCSNKLLIKACSVTEEGHVVFSKEISVEDLITLLNKK